MPAIIQQCPSMGPLRCKEESPTSDSVQELCGVTPCEAGDGAAPLLAWGAHVEVRSSGRHAASVLPSRRPACRAVQRVRPRYIWGSSRRATARCLSTFGVLHLSRRVCEAFVACGPGGAALSDGARRGGNVPSRAQAVECFITRKLCFQTHDKWVQVFLPWMCF